MAKLNQIIAVVSGRKSQTESALGKVHHLLQKPELLSGLSRTYTPRDDDGEKLPPESKQAQYSAVQGIEAATVIWKSLFDAVAAQDNTNCIAKADVVVDGVVVLANVPVTHLLFLEKQLVDIHTFVDKLPVLDPAERWSADPATGVYRSEVSQTLRNKKVFRNHVKAEATDKHPAQVEVFTEDVPVGTWSTTKFSGAVMADERRGMLERVRALQEAVKFAREEANSVEVVDLHTGKPILDFVFGDKSAA